MSDISNPYESPQSDLNARSPVRGGGISENMLRYLKEASPWIRFLAILGHIISGLSLLGGAVLLIVSFFVPGTAGNFFAGAPAAAGALVYLVVGILGVIPARFLYKFGSRIRSYVQTNVDSELEEAFKNNKSFWKFAGIMAIVYLAVLPVLGIVFFIVAAGAGLLT